MGEEKQKEDRRGKRERRNWGVESRDEGGGETRVRRGGKKERGREEGMRIDESGWEMARTGRKRGYWKKERIR